MNKYDYLIGIDPDVDKSGVAILETKTKKLEASVLCFFDLFSYLRSCKNESITKNETVLVVIEAGWFNKPYNFHATNVGARVSAKIGANVGANHQVGKLIVQMCDYLKLEYKLVRPANEKWNKTFCEKVTGIYLKVIPAKNRQEAIDAIKLIWS